MSVTIVYLHYHINQQLFYGTTLRAFMTSAGGDKKVWKISFLNVERLAKNC